MRQPTDQATRTLLSNSWIIAFLTVKIHVRMDLSCKINQITRAKSYLCNKKKTMKGNASLAIPPLPLIFSCP